jgi:fumarate hydratase, class II
MADRSGPSRELPRLRPAGAAEVVHAHAMLKWAAATANEETGVVDAEVADAIRRAADEVIDGQLDEHFPVDVFQTGSGTSTNMNVNEVVANRAKQLLGEDLASGKVHPNDHVNASQSSNDTFPTSVHVAVARVAVDELIPALQASWRRRCGARPTSGRTWSSRAAPT